MQGELNIKKSLKIIGGFFAFLLLWPILRAIATPNDLNLFFSASKRLLMHQNLYEPGYESQGWVLKYYYSPLFASLLLPFTFLSDTLLLKEQIPLSIVVLKSIWGLLMVWFIWDMAKMVHEEFQFSSSKKLVWFWSIFAVLTWRWCFLNILYGQMTILVLWGVMRAFKENQRSKVNQLLPMSLGINIKILPVFILGQYFLLKQWRAFFTVIFLTVLLGVIPFAFLPFEYHFELIKGWMHNINPFSGSHIVEIGEGGFVDFGALLTKYFTSMHIPGEATIHGFHWTEKEIFWFTQVFRVMVLTLCWLTLILIQKGSFQNKAYWQMAVFLGVVPLAFPHQRDYSLMLQLPMVSLIVKDWVEGMIRLTMAHKILFIIGGILMGNILFLEAFPAFVRISWQGMRFQGIGGLIVWFSFIHYILFSSSHLVKEARWLKP